MILLFGKRFRSRIKTERTKDGKRKVRNAGTKRRGRRTGFILAVLFLLAAGGLYFYFRVYRVEPVFTEITYEYGDAVSRDITDYLAGTDWSVHLGELDLSGVDESETGTYEAVVIHGREEYVYRITIQDTVPPEILWKEGQIYLAEIGRASCRERV